MDASDNRALSLVVCLWVCLAKSTCALFQVLHPDRDCDLSNETDIRPLGGDASRDLYTQTCM
ncbi:hypothetical protein CRG98_021029 [Punica granatum]|uniref:Uncharacterized protein n=1 Tax=Punica granatum TaxID=22663 RepID=A0A2I0JSW6_PUNGR|nr:hypothetical protein CRG98_021029 [Punica granatum]